MSKRLSNFELLRFVAMILIITGHLLGDNGGNLLKQTTEFSVLWFVLWTIEAFCVQGTNCFVLISGYFALDHQFSWKKVLNLCLQVWFYSLLLYGISIIFKFQPVSLRGLIHALTPILGRNWWFISTYLGIYILSPYFCQLIKNMDKKTHEKLIFVLLALFSLIPTISPFKDTFASGQGSGIAWFMTLYCIAMYIRLYMGGGSIIKDNKKLMLLYILTVSLIMLSKIAISYGTKVILGHPIGTSVWFGNCSILNLLASLFLFLIFHNLHDEVGHHDLFSKASCLAGSVCFGVYMIHNNIFTSAWMWRKILSVINSKSIVITLLCVLIVPILIFVICGMIDKTRQIVFKIFHVA